MQDVNTFVQVVREDLIDYLNAILLTVLPSAGNLPTHPVTLMGDLLGQDLTPIVSCSLVTAREQSPS